MLKEPYKSTLLSVHLTFKIFTYSLFVWLVVAHLFKDGMFTDGVQYATVARNLALGLGTWWEPHFSKTMFDRFHQQPPGAIWLQAFFFKTFGDSIYPERIHCLVTGVIMLILIASTWIKMFDDSNLKQMSWWPQLIWLSIPTVSWGLKNNVTENTMVIFDWLSVAFLLRVFEKN